jgi:predicted Ser/Thr protein kinase
MMERNACPKCGRDIAPGRSEGLCPACLLEEGMKSLANPQCPACSSDLAEDARFCAQCGAAVPLPAAHEGDALRKALELKLKGQYRIVRLLGRGGMGAVYLARDLSLDREVAIKVVSTVAESQEMKERFRREARTAAKLSHPNIVPLHSFGDVEGMPYFVMGYVRGESLAARLRREGKLEEEEARRILADVADALDHAHRQGVIHRDIKPDNVLLEDESGRALLTDFGVAKAVGQGETLTRLGNAVGTPHYMSPEQASGGGVVDGRSDIYSLGVMAYAMLAGRLPFEGQTPAEVLTKHLTQAPPRLSAIAPSISDATVQTVERCLAKDPLKRWPDARSLKLALGGAEESHLPEGLRAVEGLGAPTVLVALVFYGFLPGGLIKGDDVKDLLFIGTVMGVSWVVAYLFMLMRLRSGGYGWGESQRAFWTEPSWWPAWYPRRLRRRGNVWDRLPASARAMRWWFAALPLLFFLMPMAIIAGRFEVGPGKPLFAGLIDIVVGTGVLIALWLVLNVRARNDLGRRGLAAEDAQRVAFSVPLSRVSFWSRPHIAAILAPAVTEGTRPEAPSDHLQTILRNANELAGPLRSLGAQAAVAARQLLTSVDDADREIEELARSIEPGEEERLTEKITALTHEEHAPLRTLLEKQRELIRELSARVEEAQERRNRRVETLKTLALHVTTLRSRATVTPSEARLISDNVRALCDDIARQTAALTAAATAPAVDDTPTMERGSRM